MSTIPPVSAATKYQQLLDDLGGARPARRALMGEDVRVEQVRTGNGIADGNFRSVEVVMPRLMDVGRKDSPNWPFIKDHTLKPRRFHAAGLPLPPRVKCRQCKGTGWHGRRQRHAPPPGNCTPCNGRGLVSPLDEMEAALNSEAADNMPVCGLFPIQHMNGTVMWVSRETPHGRLRASITSGLTSRQLALRLYRAGFAERATMDHVTRLEQRVPCPDCTPGSSSWRTRCPACVEANRDGWIRRKYRLFRLYMRLPRPVEPIEELVHTTAPNSGTAGPAIGNWLFLLRLAPQPPKPRGTRIDLRRNPHWPLIIIELPMSDASVHRLDLRPDPTTAPANARR